MLVVLLIACPHEELEPEFGAPGFVGIIDESHDPEEDFSDEIAGDLDTQFFEFRSGAEPWAFLEQNLEDPVGV